MSDPIPLRCRPQATLRRSVATRGVGMHGGRTVQLRLSPAAPDSGLVFVRHDLPATVARIPARWDHVVDTRLSTVLANAHGSRVSTVEHLMAALRAAGVDNALIELDGAEVPILDGSAAPWLALIDAAGVVAQAAARRVIRLHRAVRVVDGDKWAELLPAASPRFSIEIDFADRVIGHQQYELAFSAAAFRREIADARTFGFVRDIETLRAAGLARGGSMDNAVVVGEHGVLNPGGLRHADEFVRHKLLDCVGDLYLAGAPIIAHVRASRVGHALNNQLLRAMFADAGAWSFRVDTRVRPPATRCAQVLAA